MINLILVSLFGKYKAFLEANGKVTELETGIDGKDYSTCSFLGPSGLRIFSDEIPYVNGKRTLDNISFSFGRLMIPIMDVGMNLVERLGKIIGGVYFIIEPQPPVEFDSFIRSEVKRILERDVYKGTTSYSGLMRSIGLLYSFKNKKSINVISPNYVYSIKYDSKQKNRIFNGIYGITSAQKAPDVEMHDEFVKRFSKYLDLYEEEKKIEILKGMFLGGYYSYIYEGLENDIINRYQDRKYIVPFSEIKKFIDEIQIPIFKSVLDKDETIYSVNIPKFNEYFKEYNIKENFIMSQEDFMLYSKMLIDFNNDMSVKPYKHREKDFIWFFGNSAYGRKSKEFQKKQIDFIDKAMKKN